MKYTLTWHTFKFVPYKPGPIIRFRFFLMRENWRNLVIVKEAVLGRAALEDQEFKFPSHRIGTVSYHEVDGEFSITKADCYIEKFNTSMVWVKFDRPIPKPDMEYKVTLVS